jgi:hypothetical protein
MYSIGTSAVKFLRTVISDSAAVDALDKRMAAFVGTALERDGGCQWNVTAA